MNHKLLYFRVKIDEEMRRGGDEETGRTREMRRNLKFPIPYCLLTLADVWF
jgi:hypothetical protein